MLEIKEIEQLAELVRVKLTENEKESLRKEFDSILGYVASLQKVAANVGAHPRSIVATVNVMREDGNPHESGIYTEALVGAAPRREGDYIKVKKIL